MRLSWGCDNFKAKNIFILSQTEPWEILVRVAITCAIACVRGYIGCVEKLKNTKSNYGYSYFIAPWYIETEKT